METLKLTPDSLPLSEKIRIAIERIREFEPPDGYHAAFSGGKDSQTYLELAKMAGVMFDAHFNFTTVDPPELLRFIRDNYPDVQWDRPKRTMWQLIVSNGPPDRRFRFCCRALKERGGKGRFVLTGVRKEESTKRANRRMVEICYQDNTRRFLHPIIDWRERDVWEFIRERSLKYCELYDQGFDRIGCVGCPMAGRKRIMQFERWPGYKKAYLKAFGELIDRRLECGGNLTWQTPEEVMEWWLRDRKEKADPDQLMIFSD